MWVMTSFGVLMPALRPEKYMPVGDDRKLQIRAREKHHLDTLRALYMQDSLGVSIYTPDKDYEYRAYCTHEAWSVAMMKMSMEIDYVKFKPTTDRFKDHKLHSLYNSIWSTMFNQLSTRSHRERYWTDYDKKYPAPAGGSTAKKAGGSGNNNGWPDDPGQKSTQRGYSPDDVKPRSPQFSGGAAEYDTTRWDDCRTPMPEGYQSKTYRVSPGGSIQAERYDCTAGRDRYEPEVWQGDVSTDHTAQLDSNGMSDDEWETVDRILDALPTYHESKLQYEIKAGDPQRTLAAAKDYIAELELKLSSRMSHTSCGHGSSERSVRRCRNKFSLRILDEIEDIEKLIKDVEDELKSAAPPALPAGAVA